MCRCAMLGSGTAAAAQNMTIVAGRTSRAPQRLPDVWVVQQTAQRRSRLAATATLQAQQLMQNVRLTQLAQELCRQVLRPGDTAVDATCGNGHDTAFLAAAVGSNGTVHAFDIQQTALDQTRAAVGEGTSSLPALHFHLASHADMLQHVDTSCARVVMFNLGYLPGSDKGTTTQVDSTLAAVQAACEVLQAGGLCSVLCYTGHSGGVQEYEAVKELVAGLSSKHWVTSELRLLNRPTAPVLLLLWKRL